MVQWWGGLQTFTPRVQSLVGELGTYKPHWHSQKKKLLVVWCQFFKIHIFMYICQKCTIMLTLVISGWGNYFLIPKRDNYYLYTFFLCSVLFITLWFLNTKGIYVKGYIFFYIVFLC